MVTFDQSFYRLGVLEDFAWFSGELRGESVFCDRVKSGLWKIDCQ